MHQYCACSAQHMSATVHIQTKGNVLLSARLDTVSLAMAETGATYRRREKPLLKARACVAPPNISPFA